MLSTTLGRVSPFPLTFLISFQKSLLLLASSACDTFCLCSWCWSSLSALTALWYSFRARRMKSATTALRGEPHCFQILCQKIESSRYGLTKCWHLSNALLSWNNYNSLNALYTSYHNTVMPSILGPYLYVAQCLIKRVRILAQDHDLSMPAI